jgi:hypothetical protein
MKARPAMHSLLPGKSIRRLLLLVLGSSSLLLGVDPVFGSDYQADGTISVIHDEPVPHGVSPTPYVASFSISSGQNRWLLKISWPRGIQSWISWDGTNSYQLSRMGKPYYQTAGTVRLGVDPSAMVEFERCLIFAFGLPLPQSPITVPFLSGDDPANEVFALSLQRLENPPFIPEEAFFPVSEQFLISAISRLAAKSDTNGVLAITQSYSMEVPPSTFELLASTNLSGQTLPVSFELVHCYMAEGQIRRKHFSGQVTNYQPHQFATPLPPLVRGASVQDLRSGQAFLYKAKDTNWLTMEQAVSTGILLVPATKVNSGSKPFTPNDPGKHALLKRVVQIGFLVVVICPLLLLIYKWTSKGRAPDLR